MVMVDHTGRDSGRKGLVFNIERFCVHDGPGIRTLVFLKGCPLSCRWCANPESISSKPQVAFFQEKCIGCGRCVEVCSENAAIRTADDRIVRISERCIHCASCVSVCPSTARLVYGKSMDVHGVFEVVYRDFPFYRRSRGGVTISGGEPLMQKEFTRSLLRYCIHKHIHTAVETCGHAGWEAVDYAFEFSDLVLFDLKHIHPLKHLKFTGVNNTQILENLKRLDAEGKSLIIRVPVVPGFNATVEEMQAMADHIAGLKHPHPCHLLPYHALGNSKYGYLGMKPRFQPIESLSREQLLEFCTVWKRRGIETQIGG
jgi:pyruvate formate lyase activating enzyme